MSSPLPSDEDRAQMAEMEDVIRREFIAWAEEEGEDTDLAQRLRRVVWLAGFRRSVVSTPSDEVLRDLVGRMSLNHRQVMRDPEGLIWTCICERWHGGDFRVHQLREELAAVSAPSTITDDEAIAIAFAESDDMNHEDLCHCRQWPESCATYGERRPWTHNAEFVARAALRVALGRET